MVNFLNTNFVPAGYEPRMYDDDLDDDDFDQFDDDGPNFVQPAAEDNLPLTQERIIAKILHTIQNDGYVDSIREFLNDEIMQGFDIDSFVPPTEWTLLMEACFEAQAEVVKFLLDERGASSMKTSKSYQTSMIIACRSAKDSDDVLKVVKILADHPMVLDSEDDKGMTALMHACYAGHLKVVEYLLKTLKVSCDLTDRDGHTALMHALLGKCCETAEFLINFGVDLTIENKKHKTAIEIARRKKLLNVVEMFPKPGEVYEIPFELENYTADNMLPGQSSECPLYSPDVFQMLRGMNSEQFAANFAKADISLEEFLSIDDDKLKKIGVQYPFQRHFILEGLSQFHTEPWSPNSFNTIIALLDSELFSYEFVIFIANLLKQSMLLKSHMHHAVSHAETVKSDTTVVDVDEAELATFRNNITQLQNIVTEMQKKSQKNALQPWWHEDSDRKGFAYALKYFIFAFSSTLLLFVFRRFFKR